jgi:hypothetical protein
MRKRAKKKATADRVLNSLVNVLSLVYAHFYFPTYSNGLKEVGACLSCSWSDPDASGVQSVVWRRRWESTRDEQWKQKLMTYNLEDCAALKRVAEFIHAAIIAVSAAPGSHLGAEGKRTVIEYRARVQQCRMCGQYFIPERYKRIAKHFHGLMFEHVAHRLSFGIVEEMLRESFDLVVSRPEIHEFKSLMARYYRLGYKRLLAKILSGSVLHIDETKVKLKTGEGYVWVFASLEDVVFLYRPTREGDFLKKLLKNFKGVLVSDFYAAYDSIDCPQQKCLIHLLKDMNQDLLSNPFDEELQAVTGPFGVLLRAVVTTIDRHGLKRCHLKNYDRAVARFFKSLAEQSLHSEVAEALRQRLLKNRDKLFTFIQHDGVPWNNNNAENAIKRFAYYREGTIGVMKEAGLKDYLVLLSLCHTCCYRSISFLKFLLSRERDIDAFGTRGRARRQRPAIEVYPKDFVPHHLARLQERATQKSSGPSEQIVQR